MKLSKTESAAFATIGAAICEAKVASKSKKEALPLVSAVLAENRQEFIEGITIGDYKFSIVTRDELTAIKV